MWCVPLIAQRVRGIATTFNRGGRAGHRTIKGRPTDLHDELRGRLSLSNLLTIRSSIDTFRTTAAAQAHRRASESGTQWTKIWRREGSSKEPDMRMSSRRTFHHHAPWELGLDSRRGLEACDLISA